MNFFLDDMGFIFSETPKIGTCCKFPKKDIFNYNKSGNFDFKGPCASSTSKNGSVLDILNDMLDPGFFRTNIIGSKILDRCRLFLDVFDRWFNHARYKDFGVWMDLEC